MDHNITITTVESLIIYKALQEFNYANDSDKEIANKLANSIKGTAVDDLVKAQVVHSSTC